MKDFCIRGAIFDMDGTLLDSMPIWEHYASTYLRERGILPPPELDTAIATYTLTDAVEYLKEAFALPESPAELLAGIDRTTSALYENVLPKRGIPELLALFCECGIPMAVATMTDRPVVERTLSRLGLIGYFSHIFTCEEVGARKNTPVIYDTALAALGTGREETAVFEDAWYAVKTAAAAGYPVVAIYDPSSDRHFAKAEAVAALAVRDIAAVPWERYLPEKS